ncbi:hypothetical protein GSI_05860 [Ganoderma sinense ZZ0214-1]|uniref:Uncharacterized protein n=1 Tax=Ganoderma sinense ZZ0214-1 TaxID=1077348 RepID=A0A2G8SBP8_9APHY|nr:hypothetical protein GSI_05860 [Ganoderma sinense ZZ0214-1]
MCDLLVLWRCWVIWTALNHGLGYVVIALPALMFLASIVMGTFWIVKSVEPGNTLASPLPLQLGFAYFALSLGLNVVLTTLVVARLLAFRRANIAFLPPEHAKQYLSITAVIVESAALYSVFAIMFLITYGLKLPVNLFLLECAQASQPIAVYLIIYRVAQRKARSKDMLNEQTMSSANFCGGANARIHSATPRFINIEVEMESTVDTESGTLHNNR